MNIGQPAIFNLETYYAMIGQYAGSDELDYAIWLADHPPEYYADNVPMRLKEIRKNLQRQKWGPNDYVGIYKDLKIDETHTATHWPLRAQLLENEVRNLNDKGVRPMICEYAPGSHWLSEGLKHKGLNFDYEYRSLDGKVVLTDVRPEYVIYCAFEIIEHLDDEKEIWRESLKFDREFNMVMISTPLYCFGNGLAYVNGWQGPQHPLGHCRTYGPKKFSQIVMSLFEGYIWGLVQDDTMVLTGKR